MQIAAAGAAGLPLAYQAATAAAANQSNATAAANAFGLNFESLLKIILTQLTYQDPLKPMDNFQFVSQLAQFTQIQQSQTQTDKLQALVAAQATFQSTSLIGKVVDVPINNSGGVISGTVTAVTFQSGDARLTIKTTDGQTIGNISPTSISQIRGAN
ncbi:MAG: flagellar hook capping FlgD N-terminal domain-containing protein [Novosphingobium sp.]|uniref:flagellar hook capping FlgD N-terminal domain-containing protein n=1 Tax=Novosphingobium sp. TaxID=1874826 RepID=UPI0032B8590A